MPRTDKPGKIASPKGVRRFLTLKTFFAIACTASILYITMSSPFFYISDIQVTGLSSYQGQEPADAIRKALDLTDGARWRLTDSIFYKTRRSMERSIEELPHVKKASVAKLYPGTLTISVTERTLHGYVEYPGMDCYLYIDGEGVVLDVRQETEMPPGGYEGSLPVITGLRFTGFVVGEKLAAENKDAFSNMTKLGILFEKYGFAGVVRIDVSDSADIRLYLENIEIVLGTIFEADEKLITAKICLAAIDKSIPGTLYVSNKDMPYFHIFK